MRRAEEEEHVAHEVKAATVEWNPAADRLRELAEKMPNAVVTEFGNVAVKARVDSLSFPSTVRLARRWTEALEAAGSVLALARRCAPEGLRPSTPPESPRIRARGGQGWGRSPHRPQAFGGCLIKPLPLGEAARSAGEGCS